MLGSVIGSTPAQILENQRSMDLFYGHSSVGWIKQPLPCSNHSLNKGNNLRLSHRTWIINDL